MPRAHPLTLLLTALLALVAGATPVRSQDLDPQDPASPSLVLGEVDLRVALFGAGGVARAGEHVGILIEITDQGDEPREVAVTIEVEDADGDTTANVRRVTTTPGRQRPVWIYMRLPFSRSSSDVFPITVTDSRTGRVLARTPVRPKADSVVEPRLGLIGVVGESAAGLEQYNTLNTSGAAGSIGHEDVRVVRGISPVDLPDDWRGLAQFKVLLWSDAGDRGDPTLLTFAQAEAIREYVRRGGHFIVVMPQVGQTWFGAPSNPLGEIMPRANVTRLDGVDLNAFGRLLNLDPEFALPSNAAIYDIVPAPDAAPAEASAVLRGPGGEHIVTRRLIGAGMVTVVGMDLRALLFRDPRGLKADQFWHRILGERRWLRTAEDLARENRQNVFGGNRYEGFVDSLIPGEIEKSGRAAAGLLLALVVFVAFWLLAGPVGYFALKQRNWKHHSWVAFVGVVALFTGIAWGGANLLKPRRVDGRHLSLIDHVYGQPTQRTRTWLSLFLPEYGDQLVSLGDPASEEDLPADNVITWWDNPDARSSFAAFPDARTWILDSDRPASALVPTRSTVKQFQADWAGPPVWRTPIPGIASGEGASGAGDGGGELKIQPSNIVFTTAGAGWSLSGSLVHSLPEGLEDVVICVVRPQTVVRRRSQAGVRLGLPLFQASFYQLPAADVWDPGETLSLGAVTTIDGGDSDLLEFMTSLTRRLPNDTGVGGRGGRGSAEELLLLMSFMDMLDVPRPGVTTNVPNIAVRRAMHGWDLSKWLTQPCIIILGHIPEGPCPTPVYVDDEPAPLVGRTLVRWIYPLPPSPPDYSAIPEAAGDGEPGEQEG